MNYTISQILNILNNQNLTIEMKYQAINNELVVIKNLGHQTQQSFYNDLNNYLINTDPLLTIPLIIHYPLFIGSDSQYILDHYINEYKKLDFTNYYMHNPMYTNYTCEYLMDWITLINIQYFNHITEPQLLNHAYILENIIIYLNNITNNQKYGEFLYNSNNRLGLIEICLDNSSIFQFTERFMINTYYQHSPTLEIIMAEIFGGIISGNNFDSIISTNYNFFLKSFLDVEALNYDLTTYVVENEYNTLKSLIVFLTANILMSIILDNKYLLGTDPIMLLYISQLHYLINNK